MSNGAMFSAADAKRLVENLLTDLRTLSTEAKKKQAQVKEAAESGLVKIRNINSASNEQNLSTNLRLASSELLQPLIMGCASKNSRLVQVSLQAIQRMVQHRVIEPTSAPVIVNELWRLMEAECEELRILQTLTSLVSTELLVTGPLLAKCLVMCFRLNFAKDPIVINTASATVRQMVSCVYERIVHEDDLKSGELPIVHQTIKLNSHAAPPTLRPCAADGYMLFRDLCLLIKIEMPYWLVGIEDMTRTLFLELLESVLAGYPSIFFKHAEYAQLLKEQVCPLIIRLFAPKQKQVQVVSQHPHSSTSRVSIESASIGQLSSSPERPYFPTSMRLFRVVVVLISRFYQLLVTECEIFLSLLINFLESDKLVWQRAITFEVLHRVVVQPELLKWFCENYDAKPSSTKVIHAMIAGLASYVQISFQHRESVTSVVREEEQFELDIQAVGQTGFIHHGSWIPLCQNITPKKSILLDSLDKHDAILLPEGYTLSLSYYCIVDFCQCVFQAYEIVCQNNQSKEVIKELFQSSYVGLLSALSLLLEARNVNGEQIFSTDENVTEQLVRCFGMIGTLACQLSHADGRKATMLAFCKAALPAGYFARVLSGLCGVNGSTEYSSINSDRSLSEGLKTSVDSVEKELINIGQPSQVVAIGTVCPTPRLPPSAYNAQVMLTAKNLQVFRALIVCAEKNGQQLDDCWHLILTTVQHVVWILGMKPSLLGGFKKNGDGTDSGSANVNTAVMNTVLTTAVLADVTALATMLDALFDSTSKLDDVALHHVIAALCKLSSEAMTLLENGTREPSYFPVAKLQQTGMANLTRLGVFWKPITAHLIEVSGYPHASFREWGAQALTVLVKNAMKSAVYGNDEAKRQQLILNPLLLMCDIEHPDVRKKQMECMMNLLQSSGQQFTSEQWPTVIEIVAAIVSTRFSFDEVLIKQSYEAVALMVTDFLDVLPIYCIQALVETDAKYGAQQRELNISLSALGQLWTISDFIFRNNAKLSENDSETIWLVLYNCLSELCVDLRPPVRKSACQTLLQTINAHGRALKPHTWTHMIWKILFPMLDKVRAMTRSASNVRSDASGLGASNILIHHSRDTEYKQWAETSVHTLSSVVKIFNTQRSLLITLGDFLAAWSTLLQYIEYLALSDNPEMSLAALKSFQEVLFGRGAFQALEVQTRERSNSSAANVQDESPALPEALWVESWRTWMRIARMLTAPRTTDFSSLQQVKPDSNTVVSDLPKRYVPGPTHLTTMLHVFSPLFERVKKRVMVNELKRDGVPSILKEVIGVPISVDQNPYMISATADFSPVQEAVMNCIRVMYRELVDMNSSLRPALPDLICLLLDFSVLSVQVPSAEFLGGKIKDTQWWIQNVVPFAELCLRTGIEFYANTAHYQEIVQSTVLVDIVKALAVPMKVKYYCFSQSTWKAAVSGFQTALRLGLPLARQQVELFHDLWPVISDTLYCFLFNSRHSPAPLNAGERKRHEFIDCQLIELMRTEVLPYVNDLPPDFVQSIIDLLNHGSINTLDPRDVLASDSYMQRTELSKVCFDALLSMSQAKGPDSLDNSSDNNGGSVSASEVFLDARSTAHLGLSAITSLLSRCKQVLLDFVRDVQSSGHLRLPQERVLEMVSVLGAIRTLTDGMTQHFDVASVVFYSEVVGLYTLLIDCVPSSRMDYQVEQALMAALKGYEGLLKAKAPR